METADAASGTASAAIGMAVAAAAAASAVMPAPAIGACAARLGSADAMSCAATAPTTADAAKSAVMDASSVMPAPAKSVAAASTVMPVPAVIAAADSASMPGAAARDCAASRPSAEAADGPYDDRAGSAVDSSVMPAHATAMPAPTSSTAAPKATMPTAPAVRAGPIAAAPTARSAMLPTMATIATAAPAPAFDMLTAALAISHRPAPARATPAPRAMTAAAQDRMLLELVAPAAPAAFSPAAVPMRPAPAAAPLVAIGTSLSAIAFTAVAATPPLFMLLSPIASAAIAGPATLAWLAHATKAREIAPTTGVAAWMMGMSPFTALPTLCPKLLAVLAALPSPNAEDAACPSPSRALLKPLESTAPMADFSALPTTVAMPEKLDEKPFIAPAILSCPTVSMTVVMALPRRVCTLSSAVCTPPVALLACSAKLATPLPPFLSRSMMACLNFSMRSVGMASDTPTPRYSPSSCAEWPAPRMEVASWRIWPGAVSMREFQSSPCALPLDSIWVNWYIAPCAAAVPLPPASIMSLKAKPRLVDSLSVPPVAAICCTKVARESVELGSPSRWSLICWMDASALLAE